MSDSDLILLGVGANLRSDIFDSPRATCEAAVAELVDIGVTVLQRSSWYESAPVPASDQPWYVNGVLAVETRHSPEELLLQLHELERRFGRVRREPNAARSLDLDILAYGTLRRDQPPILPHPRLQERAFVLLPLSEIAPGWRHPLSGRSLPDLIVDLPPGQQIRRLPEGT